MTAQPLALTVTVCFFFANREGMKESSTQGCIPAASTLS